MNCTVCNQPPNNPTVTEDQHIICSDRAMCLLRLDVDSDMEAWRRESVSPQVEDDGFRLWHIRTARGADCGVRRGSKQSRRFKT